MRQKIDAGAILAAGGALLLVVSLFMRWWNPGGTAWQVFETLDLVLAGCAIAVLIGVLRTLSSGDGEVPGWVLALGIAVVAIVVVQLIDAPPAARHADVAAGAWVALGAGALMTIGAILSRSSIHVTIDVRERDHRTRVAAVDRRRAEPRADTRETETTRFAEPPRVEEQQDDRTQPMRAVRIEGEESG
jgi:hypothetical protein